MLRGQCFQAKELPVDIRAQEDEQQSLFGRRDIPTPLDLAQRVERSIPRKISPQAHRLVREGFLTCLPQREMALLRFLLMGYKYGGQVVRLTTEPVVHTLEKAALALRNEATTPWSSSDLPTAGNFCGPHHPPKNAVLPLVAPHFCDRLPSENFMIYDETTKWAFSTGAARGGQGSFFQADQVELPPPSREELCWQNLWKVFYRTIAVEGRRNPKLRQNLCPKRFWPLMTELEGELG